MNGNENLILAIFALWLIIYLALRNKQRKLEEKGVTLKPLVLVVKIRDIDWFFDRLTERLGRLSIIFEASPYVAYLLMLAGLVFLANNFRFFFSSPQDFTAITLVIPFVTIQSPTLLLFFFLSIPIIVIPHEFFHAIAARLHNIKLRSGGIAVLALLFAGFIEPDEDSFKKAGWKAKIKMVSSGSIANVIIGLALMAFLLTQPYTHPYVPQEIADLVYSEPLGVLVLGVIPEAPLSKTGISEGDIIVAINGTRVNSLDDYYSLQLEPNATVVLTVRRGPESLVFTSRTIEVGGRAIMGFYGITFREPVVKTPVLDRYSFSFVFWVALFSLMVAIFNMLPLYPFDGGLFINSLLEALTKNQVLRRIVQSIVFLVAASMLGGNIVASIIEFGFITL